jgi:hypothetical protein
MAKNRNVGRHTHADHRSGGALDGRAPADLADAGNSIPFVIEFAFSGATAEQPIYSANAPFKFKVIDAWVQQTGGAGGAGDTALLDNGTTAITDAMDMGSVADGTVVHATTIDDAYATIAKDGSMDVTTASSAVGTMTILCVRVA